VPAGARRRAGALALLLHGAGALALESVWVEHQVTLLGNSPQAKIGRASCRERVS
jgi:hypothetical protein